MKIKEEQLKIIQDQQEKLNELIHKDIQDFKEVLQKEYGDVNISVEDGTYTKIEEDVKSDKED